MTALPESAREVIESGALAHLVTQNEDGSPQVTCVWVGLEDDEIVAGHLMPQKKLDNIRRDPRVAISIEAPGKSEIGLQHYLIAYGAARITEGGAPELLQRLAATYLGPGVDFPPMPDPPPGWISRTKVERIAGNGPWTEDG
jgi:PPOX class probable F420-dependent enzyme